MLVCAFEGHVGPTGHIPVRCVAVSPDGRLALTGDEDGGVLMWETETARVVRRLPKTPSIYRFTRRTPAGAELVWRFTHRGEVPHHSETPLGVQVTSVAFFPDGRRVVVADSETSVIVYEASTGKEIARHQENLMTGVASIAISPDGKRVLIGSNPIAKLWDVDKDRIHAHFEGHTMIAPRQGDAGGIWSVAFSPDGKLAITGGEDGTIRLWKLPE